MVVQHAALLVTSLLLVVLAYHSNGEEYTHTWAVQIEGGEDVARAVADKHGFQYVSQIMPGYFEFKHHAVSKRSTSGSAVHHNYLQSEPRVQWVEQQVVKRRVKRTNPSQSPNDPKWARMWYLHRNGDNADMNVLPAWNMGITGQGVVVTILDDGIEKNHPDLLENYDPDASYDVNDKDNDPQPRYDFTNENRHGTRCAGEVAAKANNFICGVGVAHDASIGGVRMLDGDVTDSVEAESLSLNPQHIDIYSASWGPDDDGRTVDGPGVLAKKAFYNGITKGRGGKGSIFVWASGNGGRDQDFCNCDGYTNSIYTLSISSATENRNIPWYSEACSSTLATTYSSGSGSEREIVTTDLHKGCTERHTGTSASAPLAAGICALALQANPQLTWRDMQHIVVKTARPNSLHASDWKINGIGRKVSHSFGYGLMDAGAMVQEAVNWTTVPTQHRCIILYKEPRKVAHHHDVLELQMYSDGCRGTNNEVVYLEHVQAVLTLTAAVRGEVQIYLTSPAGTRSTLLDKRHRDRNTEGFRDWAFMTTHSWGENSQGTWILKIQTGDTEASLLSWSLQLYGTTLHPEQTAAPTPPTEPTDSDRPGQTGHKYTADCKENEYLLDNFCYAECPVQYFPSNQTPVDGLRSCEQCSQVCLQCFGSAANECLQCADEFVLTADYRCVHKGVLVYIMHHTDMMLSVAAVVFCVVSVVVFVLIFACLQAWDSYICTRCHNGGSPLLQVDVHDKHKLQMNGKHEDHNGTYISQEKHPFLEGTEDSSDDLGVSLVP